MINSSSPSKPEISPELVRVHVEIIHRLAAPLAGKGKLVTAGFGEDPDKLHPKTHKPGCPLPPSVVHFEIGDIEIAVCTVTKLTVGEHRNVYASLAVFRSDLAPGKKGFEKDIIAVLGLVADFDDADAARWAERLPLPPNLVLETSAGRFQAFYLFDKPEAFAAVKTIAARLKAYAACDHGTADLSHVWRIAGTLNWPNAKKVGAGRPREPQTVRVAKKWDGTTISLDALAAVLPASNGKPSAQKKGDSDATYDEGEITDNAPDEGADDTDDADTTTGEPGLPVESAIVGLLPPKLRVRIISAPAGDRSRNLFYVVRGLISRNSTTRRSMHHQTLSGRDRREICQAYRSRSGDPANSQKIVPTRRSRARCHRNRCRRGTATGRGLCADPEVQRAIRRRQRGRQSLGV